MGRWKEGWMEGGKEEDQMSPVSPKLIGPQDFLTGGCTCFVVVVVCLFGTRD